MGRRKEKLKGRKQSQRVWCRGLEINQKPTQEQSSKGFNYNYILRKIVLHRSAHKVLLPNSIFLILNQSNISGDSKILNYPCMLVFEDTLAKRPLFCVYYISKMNYPWVDLGNTPGDAMIFQ